MRGASAVEETIEKRPGAPLSVFAVWEPVLWTDAAPPTTSVLSRLRDPRAVQYWDPERALSREILRQARFDPALSRALGEVPEDAVVWDFVAVFPPGARWDGRFPKPGAYGFPVVEAIGDVERHLP